MANYVGRSRHWWSAPCALTVTVSLIGCSFSSHATHHRIFSPVGDKLVALGHDESFDHALRRYVLQGGLRVGEVVFPADQARPRELLRVARQYLQGAVNVAYIATPAAADFEVLLVE